jgi:arylsulfatase A-like enzyme
MAPTAYVLDMSPEVVLAPGEEYEVVFTAPADRVYTVRLAWSGVGGEPGLSPALWGGPTADEDPGAELVYLSALHGGRAAGRTEVRFTLGADSARLVVRWPRNANVALRLDRVRIAPDPGRSAGIARAVGLMSLEIGRQRREGFWLSPGQERAFEYELEDQAGPLRFAASPAPETQAGEARTIEVSVRRGGESFSLGEVTLSGPLGLWQEFELDLGDLPAGPVSFVFGARDRVALSVPEVSYPVGKRRLNVVLISLDTTRRDRLGLYGYERGTTPRLDAFAQQAVVFEDAVATAPYTLPSHATLFSGTYPAFHGAHHPAHALDLTRIPMLADVLREAGWATRAQTGGGYLSSDYGFGHGFSSYGNSDPIWDWDHPVAKARIPSAEARAASARAHVPHTWGAALDWMTERRDVPFFLFVQTYAVHDYRPPAAMVKRFVSPEGQPVVPLRRFVTQKEQPYTEAEHRYLSDVYDAGLFWVDGHVGALLDRLDALGLTDDTIVIVTADHGEELGERGFNGHGQSLKQELLSVPLLLRLPGTGPCRVTEPVSLVDVAPTLLDLVGLPRPEAMQGRSLRPLWERQPGFRPSPVLSQVDSNVSRQQSYRLGAVKIVVGDPDAVVELPAERLLSLYDLSVDPDEETSLHEDRAEQGVELSAQLERLLRMKGDVSEPVEVELGEQTLEQLRQLGYLDAESEDG